MPHMVARLCCAQRFLPYSDSRSFPLPRAFSMEIHHTKRVLGATRKSEARRAGDPVAVSPVTNPAEILSLAGVAEAELSPKLRQALIGLLSEVEQLKRDLGEA